MKESSEHLGRLQHFVNYDYWANRGVLASFKAANPVPQRGLKLLAHIIGAEFIWWARIKGEKSPLAVWPDLSLDECEKFVGELFRLWSEYLGHLPNDRIADQVTYKNSKGEPWNSRKDDILMHLITHSAYHRGQVAMTVRAAGSTPAYTDFIHSIRQGFVK